MLILPPWSFWIPYRCYLATFWWLLTEYIPRKIKKKFLQPRNYCLFLFESGVAKSMLLSRLQRATANVVWRVTLCTNKFFSQTWLPFNTPTFLPEKKKCSLLSWQFFCVFFLLFFFTWEIQLRLAKAPPPGGGGGTSLWEASGAVLLDGVAFSRLDWIWWGRIFNRVTRMGSHIFGFFGLRKFFIFTVSKKSVPECLYSRWKVKFSSFSLKDGSIHKHREWLSWDRKNY